MSAELLSATDKNRRWRSAVLTAVTFILLWIAGLALGRLLYEWRFPEWLWLARPIPNLLLATGVAVGGMLVARRWLSAGQTAVVFSPLLLNLLYLVDPAVDMARGRFLFIASLWLVAVLLVYLLTPDKQARSWRWLGPLFVVTALAPVYLATMSHAVGAADTFEFQVVAPRLGIVHPTGYPLYLLLGKLFTLLPLQTLAWRLNLASTVYAVAAVVVVYFLALDLLRRPLAALLGAVALGLSPLFWGQAIIAEVYTLHALIVAVALWLMVRLVERPDSETTARRLGLLLAAVIGLGLTNHLTTFFLLPPAALVGLFYLTGWVRPSPDRESSGWCWPSLKYVLLLLGAFALPLLLYAYLPLRWQAVNGEAMGVGRFIEWVIGGRFQGALQLSAWLQDATRYEIVGRLLLDNWGWVYLLLAASGAFFLMMRHRLTALVLLVTAAGFTFYALNYHVPDLAVFLTGTHVVIAVLMAAGMADLSAALENRFSSMSQALTGLLFLLLMLPAFLRAADLWSVIDQSTATGGEPWGRAVLAQPLAEGAAVLADSEKIAPLYYLQQVEGMRPDLDIMVLPDEATYRQELDTRLAQGQPVYLARFLPGLAGAYHLRSAGPLLEVSPDPVTSLTPSATASDLHFGPLQLLGFELEQQSGINEGGAAISLYWMLERSLTEGERPPVVFVRWQGEQPSVAAGQHPVGDKYPVNAWRPGEIVADYHALPLPAGACHRDVTECDAALQVALAPRYTPHDQLEWQTVTTIPVAPPSRPVEPAAYRHQFMSFLLDGSSFPRQVRPGVPLTVDYSGYGDGTLLSFELQSADGVDLGQTAREQLIVELNKDLPQSRRFQTEVDTDLPAGRYALVAASELDGTAVCGWMAALTTGCVLGEVEISGVALPAGAVNLGDRVALLDVDLPQTVLQPGGQLPLEITWQGLAPMTEDFTVFVQVLDARDRLVGQVDAWPVQGTFPTSQWEPGLVLVDPYLVQLSGDLPPGEYRLHIGLYLLETLQRLSVLDENGLPFDDKVEIGGLSAE